MSRTDDKFGLEREGWSRARRERAARADALTWQAGPGTDPLTRSVLPRAEPNEFFRRDQP